MATVIRRWLPALLGLAVLAGACDDAMGPDRGQARVVFQPRFAEHDNGDLAEDPALRVDNVRIVIVDEAGDTVVDQVVQWPLDQDTLRLEVAVEVAGEESFDFELQGREGNTILFRAVVQGLNLSSGNSEPQVVDAVLEYSGPEAGLEAIDVLAPGTAFLAGDQVQLTALGTDSAGEDVEDPLMVWSSLDTLAATIDSSGTVRVKHDGSRTARIVGRVAFRTLADTLALPVVPATLQLSQQPATITAIGFDQSTNAVGLGVNGDTVRNSPIQWTVRDPGVARLVNGFESGGLALVRAVANGATWLVGTIGPTVDSVAVTVDQVVTGAAPVPTRAILPVGETVQLAVAAVDAGGTTVADAPAPDWMSDGPGVAAVDPVTGLVTAVSAPAPFQNGVAVEGTVEDAGFAARIEVVDGANVGSTTAISVGDFHACRIENANSGILCRGRNEAGQLGNESTADSDYEVQTFNGFMGAGDTYTAVTAGGGHTCAIMDTVGGTQAFCWGDNRFGQLGDFTLSNRTQPTPVITGSVGADLTTIAAGGVHTCALTAAGTPYCWGNNFFGQLGDGNLGVPSLVPAAVTGGHSFTQLAVGGVHTCGLKADGTVWCWGRGEEGQLGDGNLTDSDSPVQVAGSQTFTSIEAGAAHTCGITPAGGVRCWGYNSSGQVGVGTEAFVVPEPTAVTFPTAVTITDLALGWIHGCALGDNGSVHCWGGNDRLQLGRSDPRVTRSPIPTPLDFSPTALSGGGGETCGIVGTRTICWGGIPRGYLGRDVLVIPPTEELSGGVLSLR